MRLSLPMSEPDMHTPGHEGVFPWVVLYQGHPVRFVTNVRKAWSVCHIDEATTFPTADDAYVKLVDWNLRGNGKFTVRRKEAK